MRPEPTPACAAGDRLHLVEQYRYPVAGRRWEFPSGGADQPLDVDAPALATRELREETGREAGVLTPLGTIDITAIMFSQRSNGRRAPAL